jgi:hypothetical protein
MAVQRERHPRRPRIVRSKNVLTKEFVEECKALQERILAKRGGKLMPSSVDDIRAMREGELR